MGTGMNRKHSVPSEAFAMGRREGHKTTGIQGGTDGQEFGPSDLHKDMEEQLTAGWRGMCLWIASYSLPHHGDLEWETEGLFC